MKNKLITKILALAGVMLMLLALAIPCFASEEAIAEETAENVPDTTYYMPYADYITCYNFSREEYPVGGVLTDLGLLLVSPFGGADGYTIEHTYGKQFYYNNDLVIYCGDYFTVMFGYYDDSGEYQIIQREFQPGETISFSNKPLLCKMLYIGIQGGGFFDGEIYIDWANNPIHAKDKAMEEAIGIIQNQADEITQLNTTIDELNDRIELLAPSHGGIYFSIYNIIDNHVFGGEAVEGNTYDLVTTLLSVLACVLMVCLPFLVVFLVIKSIRG